RSFAVVVGTEGAHARRAAQARWWSLIGGTVGGGWRRSGSSLRSVVVAAATAATARSKTTSAPAGGRVVPLTLRTYCRAAASISAAVAGGCSPRRIVMLRHIRIFLAHGDRGTHHSWRSRLGAHADA